jgi:Cu-Zn family superoxide dismutase
MTVALSGLKEGVHGVHLHAVGKCEPPFTSAGGHFDPGPAGNMDPDANHPFHLGDIPPITAGKDGKATMRVVTTRVTLSDGPLSLLTPTGRPSSFSPTPTRGSRASPDPASAVDRALPVA